MTNVTLAAENSALKAENARLREALDNIKRMCVSHVETIKRLGVAPRYTVIDVGEMAEVNLNQPAPTTPETDKAQAVIDAACAVADIFSPVLLLHPETKQSYAISHYESLDNYDELIQDLKQAVEAYRGGA